MRIKSIYTGIVGGALLCAALLAINGGAQGIWGFVFIDENGNGAFDAGEWNSTAYEGVIQDAVDNASGGDTIYVWDGEYYEDNITIDKPLTIIGNTTVDALQGVGIPTTSYLYYWHRGFVIDADYVNISGFYMMNMGMIAACGGVSINNSEHCNISGNIIMGDYDGIYLNNSHNNTIYNNYISNNFIGIWMVNGSGHNTIEMNNISWNNYGIVYASHPYDYIMPPRCWNTIAHNNISNNLEWGVLMGNTSNETIVYNWLYHNGYGLDGDDGKFILGDGFPLMFSGGAIACFNTVDSTIAHNTIRGPYGIDLRNCTNVTVEYNDLFWERGMTVIWLSYDIYAMVGSTWELVETIHAGAQYAPTTVILPEGTTDVRIEQHGGIAAHMDYVALYDGDAYYEPSSAIIGGNNVLEKLAKWDSDVADVHESSLELSWSEPQKGAVLLMVANEEQQPQAVRAYYTPWVMFPSLMETYTLQNNGAMVIDGVPDALGMPDFSEFWRPLGTGHPWGDTYVWLRSDGEYLYAVMEITSDNTYDDTGWGALYLVVDGTVKEFRVDAYDNTYGVSGFVYTDTVDYQHMVYEFKIPLAEIDAGIGDTIRIGYGAYGTSASLHEGTGIHIAGYGDMGGYMNTIVNCLNTVQYNTLYNYGSGIVLDYTDNETVMGNGLYNCTYGIEIYNSRDNHVSLNDVIGNMTMGPGSAGIGIYNMLMVGPSPCFNLVENNTVMNYYYGIRMGFTDNETITHNILLNNNNGIHAGVSDNNTFTYNTIDSSCASTGIYVGIGKCNDVISHNTISGHYTGIYLDHENHETVSYNEIFNNTEGIWLYGTDDSTISNNNIYWHWSNGTILQYSTGNIIDGNTITFNGCGIYMDNSSNTNITDNIITDNYVVRGEPLTGIHIEEGSNHTDITGNTIARNDIGIYVYGGNMWDGYENVDTQIHYNDIYDNWIYGVWYDIIEGDTPWINATYNWWGAVNGPGSEFDAQWDPITHNYAEGDGDWLYGSSVYNNIHFDPWLGLMLYEGWNLVSPGFIGDVENASDLAAFINEHTHSCTIVSMWDAVQQKYVSYVVGFGFDFSLVNGSGYFVYVTEDVDIYNFSEVELLEPEINITLLPGYNLLGWPFVGYISASELADNITHTLKVGTYDAELQIWLPEYFVTMPIFDFDVLMGEGVFVYVTEVATWTVEMEV